MTYTDKHEINVKEISVATFNGDPFAVESNDEMNDVANILDEAADLIELTAGDEDFETWAERLDFDIFYKLPARIFVMVDGNGTEMGAFVMVNDNPFYSKPDQYQITKRRDGDDREEIVDTFATKEEAIAGLERIVRNVANDDMIWIDSEEDAQSWLDEIKDEQPERAGWLKSIISSGEYGLYTYDSDLEYLKGEESFNRDVYRYDIEKRYL